MKIQVQLKLHVVMIDHHACLINSELCVMTNKIKKKRKKRWEETKKKKMGIFPFLQGIDTK